MEEPTDKRNNNIPKTNFTSVYADVFDALEKLQPKLRKKINLGDIELSDEEYVKYLVNNVDPVLNLRTKAMKDFIEEYRIYETVKLIEMTEAEYKKVQKLIEILDNKRTELQSKVQKNSQRVNTVPNWGRERSRSFPGALKKIFTRKTGGGKRKKTRKH